MFAALYGCRTNRHPYSRIPKWKAYRHASHGKTVVGRLQARPSDSQPTGVLFFLVFCFPSPRAWYACAAFGDCASRVVSSGRFKREGWQWASVPAFRVFYRPWCLAFRYR